MHFEIDAGAPMCIIRNRCSSETVIPTLIDSGAFMPVWCNSIETLRSVYNNAQETDLFVTLNGFGNGAKNAPVWVVPAFTLSDGNESVIFTQLHIAVCGMAKDFSMIMSFNMLNHANTVYSHHSINNDVVRTLDINYDKKCLLTTKVKTAFGSNEVSEISVNAQADVGGVGRTLDEIREDSFFYAEASSYGVDPMDAYKLLSVVVKDKTTMSNLEIIEKLNELVRSGS